MDAISSMEFDYVASGHYAKVVHASADQMDKDSALELSQDMVPKSDICWNSFILPSLLDYYIYIYIYIWHRTPQVLCFSEMALHFRECYLVISICILPANHT